MRSTRSFINQHQTGNYIETPKWAVYLLLFARISLNKIGFAPILTGEVIILLAYNFEKYSPLASLLLAIIWPIIWLWFVVIKFISSIPELKLEEYLTVAFQTTRVGRLILNFCEYKNKLRSK